MYPLSSNKKIQKYKDTISGKKPIIEPTPPIIPSTTNEVNHGDALASMVPLENLLTCLPMVVQPKQR